MDISSPWPDDMLGNSQRSSLRSSFDENSHHNNTCNGDMTNKSKEPMMMTVEIARPSLYERSKSKKKKKKKKRGSSVRRVKKSESTGDSSKGSSSSADRTKKSGSGAYNLTPVRTKVSGYPSRSSTKKLYISINSQDMDDTATDLSYSDGSASSPTSSSSASSPSTVVHQRPSSSTKSSFDDGIVLKMVEEYSLLDVPEEWLKKSTNLRQLCQDGDAWRTYSKFRRAVKKGAGCRPRTSDGSASPANNNDQEDIDLLMKQATRYLRDLSSDLSYPYPKCIGAFMWYDNAHIRINDIELSAEEEGSIDSLDITAMVFCPLSVPRAIQLGHRYDRRKAAKDEDITIATWEYRTIDFGVGGHDRHIKRGMWTRLASVELDNDTALSTDVSGLTSEAVSNMRGWLFGTSDGTTTADVDIEADAEYECQGATSFLDDYAFLSLVFASTFTPLTPMSNESSLSSSQHCSPLCQRCIGPTWPSNQMVLDEGRLRINELQLELRRPIRQTSWLEYEVRKVAGCLRRQDEYFEM